MDLPVDSTIPILFHTRQGPTGNVCDSGIAITMVENSSCTDILLLQNSQPSKISVRVRHPLFRIVSF
jgi:hypothetical protein